jgi:hypothetical protein
MNVEIVTEATQFPEKEYLNGIFLAVWGWKEREWQGEEEERMSYSCQIEIWIT